MIVHSKKNIIAFDTNMLLNIARFKVDVFAEARALIGSADFVVPEAVVSELGKLEKKGLKLKKEIAVARATMEKNNVKTVKTGFSNADEALKNLASEGCAIATNDKELKDAVMEMNGTVLHLRQRKYLEMA